MHWGKYSDFEREEVMLRNGCVWGVSVSPKWLGGYRGHRGHRGQKGDGLRGGRRDILADIISALNSHLKKYKKYFFTPRIGLWTTNCGSDQGFLNAKWVFFMSSFCWHILTLGNSKEKCARIPWNPGALDILLIIDMALVKGNWPTSGEPKVERKSPRHTLINLFWVKMIPLLGS